MTETKRISVTVTVEMHRALTELAEDRGQAMGYIVRESIAAYLERSRKKVSEVHPPIGGKRPGAGRPTSTN